MLKLIRAALAGLALSAVVAVAAPAPAQAAPNLDDFDLSVVGCGNGGDTWGRITWHNRTATVTGTVWDRTCRTVYSEVRFKAFADRVLIDTETRSANNDVDSSLDEWRDFEFTIGDTNLVGGIDRVFVELCAGSACAYGFYYKND
jgi:hypothetical protein